MTGSESLDQAIQIVGALMILIAFAASQVGWMAQRGAPYLLLNLLGAVILGVVALTGRQWGFLMLEVAWTLVSGWGLARLGLKAPGPGVRV